jgi:hypothetical protein
MSKKVVYFILAISTIYGEGLIPSKITPFVQYPENQTIMAGFDSLNTRFIGNWPFGESYAVSFDTIRNLVFCGSGGGVYILDVSNPANPQKISEKIHTRGIVEALFYESSSKILYIAAGQGGLEIWDVSDPSSPFKLGYYFTPGYAYGVYVSGSYAYVADEGAGLRIINISNPSNPYEAGYYDTPDYAYGVYVSGSYAYVADYEAGLQIYEFYGYGVEEDVINPILNIRLVKNLVSNEIKLIFEKPLKEEINISLYNPTGQKLRVYSIKNGSKNVTLDVKGIKSGIYFLTLESKSLRETIKVIVR